MEHGDKQIKLSLTTKADPALYTQPLTLTVKVPAAWKSVQAVQGEAKSTVEVKEGVVMFDATPGSTEIVLTPAP